MHSSWVREMTSRSKVIHLFYIEKFTFTESGIESQMDWLSSYHGLYSIIGSWAHQTSIHCWKIFWMTLVISIIWRAWGLRPVIIQSLRVRFGWKIAWSISTIYNEVILPWTPVGLMVLYIYCTGYIVLTLSRFWSYAVVSQLHQTSVSRWGRIALTMKISTPWK